MTLPTIEPRLHDFLETHKYYGYLDILSDIFANDEVAFLEAWCMGRLPPTVQKACWESMQPGFMQYLLLRKIVQQLDQLLARTPNRT